MNEDIKILREALAKYAEFVEVDDGDPMEVPYRLYQKANTEYRQACDPDRIRRLLDHAERLEWILQQWWFQEEAAFRLDLVDADAPLSTFIQYIDRKIKA